MKRNTVIESLINAHETPAVIIDKNYRIVAANRAYCTSYGVTADSIVGHCCHEISHHSPVPCHQNGEDCPHKTVMATNSPFEVMHTHYDYANRPDRVRIKAYPIETTNGDRFLLESIHRLAPAVYLTCAEMRMVGHSPAFLQCMQSLTLAAKTSMPVLLYGETGVGKEMAAEYIHEQSERRAGPYIEMNCAAIPEALFESELFGHERGAFTGCAGLKPGLFEAADKGTLLLDEIGELPLSMQAKLLRVLDTGKFRRLGGNSLIKADVRLLTSTNRDLLRMVANGTFREDLYFRIAGVNIHIPPLRERRSDIPALVQALIKRMCSREKAARCHVTKEAMEHLMTYRFPGNVRELLTILQRAMALGSDGVITPELISFDYHFQSDHADRPDGEAVPAHAIPQAPVATMSNLDQPESLEEVETRHIAVLLRRYRHDLHKVAAVLGVSERTLYRKMKRYRLSPREVTAE